MKVRFWGTRGSIPKPGQTTLRYGGNTACVEVQSDEGTLVVLDCGTGAHGLGRALANRGAGLRGHLLITHTHWDHIQGIPFFAPFFAADNEWHIYAPRGLAHSMRETLAGQMQYAYFPITLEQMGARIRFHDLVEGQFQINDVTVQAQYLNHSALTLGYRLSAGGACVVYASDHEPYARALASGIGPVTGQDRRHVAFLEAADLVIHDAQFTAEEYIAKTGWGHSSVEYAVLVAREAGASRLAFTHHDPLRTDDDLDRIVEHHRTVLENDEASLQLFAAAEGQVVDVEESRGVRIRPSLQPADYFPPALKTRPVLVAIPDREAGTAVREALHAEGVAVISAPDASSVIRLTALHRPSLILLDEHLPDADALTTCRQIREIGTPDALEATVVIVGAQEKPASAAMAGASDWLIEPFTTTYVRTRIKAWLLRVRCRWARAPLPENEETRLAVLRRLKLLDTQPEERFDRLTRLAAALFEVPVALVSLVDRDRQWLKSCFGCSLKETSRESSFCAHAILERAVTVVPDTLLDWRFADNPHVTGEPHIRFYAGCPLTSTCGSCVGTLCIIDERPRELTETQIGLLRDLGHLVEKELTPADD